MSFRSQFNELRAKGYSSDLFGTTVVYNDAAVPGAIFRQLDADYGEAGRMIDRGELRILRSSVANWAYGDEVVVDGRSWTVRRSLAGTDDFRLVLLVEAEQRKVW
jgi:hypothetical protein